MIKIENTEVYGFEAAIRGMRNPMNSWDKSDSFEGCNGEVCGGDCSCWYECYGANSKYIIGENDLKLMKNLSKAGSDHGKYLRMITVTCDITAPLYWWKEFDTYKVGTVANSCSTMHKIHAKEFTLDDFSHEHLVAYAVQVLEHTIKTLNQARYCFLNFDELNADDRFIDEVTCKKDVWWQMIQLLPTSYNQRRTVQLNYQVLKNMYFARKNHKLDEWKEFCLWAEGLPYFKEIVIAGDE